MSEPTPIRTEDFQRLQQQVARLRMLVITALLAVIALASMSMLRKPTPPDPVLRTQGLVITDAEGHDRILIGAPTPASKGRKRTDDASDGILFLDATGADRLALGQMPAPFINGKSYPRIGDGNNYGMVLFDTKGNERGGMGFLGMGRAVLGLDRATAPYDAIGMMVDDTEGFAGMIINYGDPKAKNTGIELGTDANSAHIKVYGKDGLPRAQLESDGNSRPAWRFDDAESAKAEADAAKAAAAEKQTP